MLAHKLLTEHPVEMTGVRRMFGVDKRRMTRRHTGRELLSGGYCSYRVDVNAVVHAPVVGLVASHAPHRPVLLLPKAFRLAAADRIASMTEPSKRKVVLV